MRIRSLSSCAMVAAVAFLAACGGDGTTQPGDKLSAEQVQTMASALTSLLAISTLTQDARLASPAHVSARGVSAESIPITGSRACPEGGHLGVNGTFSTDDPEHLVYAFSDTLVDCGIRGRDESVWAFTTRPTLEISIVQGLDGDSVVVPRLTITQTDVGRLDFSSGELSGSCAVDMTLENQFAPQTPTADSTTISLRTGGTLCGRSVARDTSITIGTPLPP